jgi:hypothetical protein
MREVVNEDKNTNPVPEVVSKDKNSYPLFEVVSKDRTLTFCLAW